ncbi:hypothetical protein [Nocardia brasiliensis]|uniref:hypothetical protein n=1 Tax=Nocardia brasiliensis TaxID=37326 RepID=UPI003D8E1A6C
MDPISAAASAFKVGEMLGGLLFTNSVLTLLNETKYTISVAICFGGVQNGYCGGWINLKPHSRWGREIEVSRFGTDVAIYGEGLSKKGKKFTWTGNCPFYVVHDGGFQIKGARLKSAKLVSGNGTMSVVSGRLLQMSGDFTYRFTAN